MTCMERDLQSTNTCNRVTENSENKMPNVWPPHHMLQNSSMDWKSISFLSIMLLDCRKSLTLVALELARCRRHLFKWVWLNRRMCCFTAATLCRHSGGIAGYFRWLDFNSARTNAVASMRCSSKVFPSSTSTSSSSSHTTSSIPFRWTITHCCSIPERCGYLSDILNSSITSCMIIMWTILSALQPLSRICPSDWFTAGRSDWMRVTSVRYEITWLPWKVWHPRITFCWSMFCLCVCPWRLLRAKVVSRRSLKAFARSQCNRASSFGTSVGCFPPFACCLSSSSSMSSS